MVSTRAAQLLPLLLVSLLLAAPVAQAWTGAGLTSTSPHAAAAAAAAARRRTTTACLSATPEPRGGEMAPAPSTFLGSVIPTSRRDALLSAIGTLSALPLFILGHPSPSMAYTPDPDPQRESLYFISRVQEATVQQERFVNRSTKQEELKSKMKLTLRLVEKNYRLLDQINYMSKYIPGENVVEATSAGVEAVEALQNAIDYVRDELKSGPFEDGQKEYLTENLRTCRESLFVFLKYVPQDKLEGARKRVEQENVDNREEYDGDGTEGVYNPVVLPWKNQ